MDGVMFGYPTGGGGGGGGGGGSSGQLQFNSAGALGGAAGTAWDDTNRTLTLTGATITISKPLLDLSQTWNTGANVPTAIKLNVTDTVSPAGSLLLDLQVGGTSKASINKTGGFKSASANAYFIQAGAAGFVGTVDNFGLGFFVNNGNASLAVRATTLAIGLGSTSPLSWASTSDAVGGTLDTNISRLGAASLAIGNGTAGDVTGTLSLARGDFYNLRTDASNYERMAGKWSANEWYFGTENAGTGVARALHVRSAAADGFYFGSGGGDQWKIASGHMLAITDNAYDIGASGANRPRAVYAGGFVSSTAGVGFGMASAGEVYWNTRAQIFSPADGQLKLTNWAATAGAILDFATDATVKFRNTANSADAAITAASISTSSTTLHTTTVALTNGAAAQTGTLTNAPAAGNPTKWIPINDNGTTRYVPAW